MFRPFSVHAGNDHSGNGLGDHLIRVWRIRVGQLDRVGISGD